MPLTVPPGDVTHVIQLAIAPVFLLTAVGTLLNVLISRLGRAVDRRRVLAAERRVQLIYMAVFLAVATALLICLLIALAFLDALIAADLAQVVAILFMIAMLALIGSLALFMREVYLGVNTVPSSIP